MRQNLQLAPQSPDTHGVPHIANIEVQLLREAFLHQKESPRASRVGPFRNNLQLRALQSVFPKHLRPATAFEISLQELDEHLCNYRRN